MKHPPLKVWFISIAIFSAAFVAVIILTPKKKAYANTKSIAYAFDQHQANPDDTKVVFIGSSLLTYAFDDYSILNSIEGREESSNIDILKISIVGNVLEDFLTNEQFITNIKGYKPSYILIQESIFQRSKKNQLTNLKSLISRQDIVNYWNGTYFNPVKKIDSTLRQQVFADSAHVNLTIRFRHIDPEGNSQILVEFMNRLDSIPIVVVEVPLPWEMEQTRKAILKTTGYSSIIASLKENHGVTFLSFDQPLPYKYFFDESHLNDAGKKIYTEWFLDELNRLITKKLTADE